MKTMIYNIGMLAGILPAGVRKLEGEQMGHVECLHDAYLVIEDGVISEFGEGRGLQDRATPLAAGGGAQACLGEVVHHPTGISGKVLEVSVNCNHCYNRGSVIVASESCHNLRCICLSADDIAYSLLNFLIIRSVWVETIFRTWTYRVDMGAQHKCRP